MGVCIFIQVISEKKQILTQVLVLDYKLTIPKEDSSEIIYTPVNKDESELKNCLPDYFFDDLTFPIDTVCCSLPPSVI